MSGIGHNNPPPDERLDVPPVRVPGPESILDYPKKFRASIEQNDKLNPCCRQAVDHVCRVYKTPTCQKGFPWDVFIAWCKCGRPHIRLLVGERHSFIQARR